MYQDRGPACVRFVALVICGSVATGFAARVEGAAGTTAATKAGLDVRAIEGRISRGRVVKVEPPLAEADYVLPPALGTRAERLERVPAGIPLVTIELDDDATIERRRAGEEGAAAIADPVGEAMVFLQSADSGFALMNKSDAGNFLANQMVLGNGFTPGTRITRYDLTVYNSSTGPSGPADVKVSLWNGDPLGLDDDCVPVGGATPITGTTVTFSNIPPAAAPCPAGSGQACVGLHRLNATLASPVAINCPDVWMVLEIERGCGLGWRLNGGIPNDAGTIRAMRPGVGFSDFMTSQYDCALDGSCATVNGYATGTCCDNCGPTRGQPCDHTDGTFECAQATFCSDGAAELTSAFTAQQFGAYYASYIASIFAPPRITVSLLPVGNRPDGSLDPGVAIHGNEMIMTSGNKTVFLEYRVGDWDPGDAGVRLRAFQVAVEPTSFTSGLGGTLTPELIACTSNSECASALGPGSLCDDPPGCTPGESCRCVWNYIETQRAGANEFVFANDLSTVFCASATGNPDIVVACHAVFATPRPAPSPFPRGGLYAGTLVLHVPGDAAGTFTVALAGVAGISAFFDTALVDDGGQSLALVGVLPAKITIQGSAGEARAGDDTTPSKPNGGTIAALPDECACPVLDAPRGDPIGAKNRYISFNVPAFGGMQAVRVTFQNMPPPFEGANGRVMWVGPPERISEIGGRRPVIQAPTFPAFWAARLQCTPYYTDWSQYDMVHAYDRDIVPGATYHVQAIDSGCSGTDEAEFSPPLVVGMARYGDVISSCSTNPCGPPDGVVNITTDAQSINDKFRNQLGAPTKARADSHPETPDQLINIVDITYVIDAFRSLPYPFTVGPSPCGGS